VRIGITLLPEHDWSTDRLRWQRVEDLGFDHAWTYDHLAWRTLADGTWHATIPTLVAAALATQRIRLGTLVTTPNFRHPVPLAKDLMTLDVMSRGRVNIAVGAGADGYDASVMGQASLTPRERHERFVEFSGLLRELLTSPVTRWSGAWYEAVDARMIPGTTQEPRPPIIIAANGPRGMRLAADGAQRPGDGWVTLGAVGGGAMTEAWWETVRRAAGAMDDVLAQSTRAPAEMVRMLYLGSRLNDSSSVLRLMQDVERAAGLGFTDVVLAWPRPDEPFAGSERLLDDVAQVLPTLRAIGP
jgi:alkanesulfonate monooxygenase SsuD/methylene tetrahydromethanopterin reductase-like flavin-dependent oxidoreductase (luciferase family)